MAMVSLAGIIAQRIHSPRSVRNYHAQSDYHNAVDLMSYFFASPVLEANLEFLGVWVKSKFEHHIYAWRCVEAVAAALLEKKQLSSPRTALRFRSIRSWAADVRAHS
jgi:hypothetical protein